MKFTMILLEYIKRKLNRRRIKFFLLRNVNEACKVVEYLYSLSLVFYPVDFLHLKTHDFDNMGVIKIYLLTFNLSGYVNLVLLKGKEISV